MNAGSKPLTAILSEPATTRARKLNQQASAAVLARVEACNAHLAVPEPVSGRTEVSVGEHTVA